MAIKCNEVKGWGDASGAYAHDQGAIIGFAHKGVPVRFIVFKAFLESFDYDREIEVDFTKNSDDPWLVDPHISGGLKSDKVKIELKVPSSNLQEALANHYKFQVLLRFIHIQDDNTSPWTYIYLKNLIQNSEKTPVMKGEMDRDQILDYGLPVTVYNFDYTPEMDLGFYEYKNRFFAKVFTLSFEIDAATAQGFDNPNSSSRRGNTFSGKRPNEWTKAKAGAYAQAGSQLNPPKVVEATAAGGENNQSKELTTEEKALEDLIKKIRGGK